MEIRFHQGYEAQGVEQGIVVAKREALLKVLDVRRLCPTEAQRAHAEACTHLAQLDLWFVRSLTAAIADDVFKD